MPASSVHAKPPMPEQLPDRRPRPGRQPHIRQDYDQSWLEDGCPTSSGVELMHIQPQRVRVELYLSDVIVSFALLLLLGKGFHADQNAGAGLTISHKCRSGHERLVL